MKGFIALLAVIVAGCGFQLRGSAQVPFNSLYIPNAKTGIGLELKRNIEAGTQAKVVEDAKGADAILELSSEARDKVILSLGGTGRVREFRLRYSITYRVHDGKGGEFLPSNTVNLARDVTYSDAQILAKEAEELLLFRDMQSDMESDMVQQILRRLSSAQRPKPKVL